MNKLLPLILLILVPAIVLPQAGQQKKRTATTQSTEKATTKTLDKPSEKSRETMRDMLLRYEGMSSNLGKLVKVGPDFLLFEEESGRMVVSLAAVLSVREVLPGEEEENPEKTLEIRLVAAD